MTECNAVIQSFIHSFRDHFSTILQPFVFSSLIPQEARDHCSPMPCLEGSCLNTPGGYYCHCPPTRSGRHCEQLRAPCDRPPCNGKLANIQQTHAREKTEAEEVDEEKTERQTNITMDTAKVLERTF